MVTVRDVDTQDLIDLTKEELKKIEEIEAPDWSKFVKTGMDRERPPQQEDWWYIRSAAVLRKVYLKGPMGVGALRREFGGRKNEGHEPEKFHKASGKIIRKILQQLEKADLIKKKKREGRVVSPKGQKFLDNLSYKLTK